MFVAKLANKLSIFIFYFKFLIMKKIDIWLLFAVIASAMVDPDHSALFILELVYANLVLAIICKVIITNKDTK